MRRKFISLFGMSLLAIFVSAPAPRLLAQEAQKEGPPEPSVKVGDMAPDFTLKDQNGKEVSLHDFRGNKNVVLAFYIFAFTGG
jgi:cytochrome oxidase Cu insertion factor (SCO1/SenC/PrrC family)